MTNFTAITCGLLPVAIALILLSLDLKEDARREKAPDNRITYTLQDQEGRVLLTCDGDPEAIRVCLEAAHGIDQAIKHK